MKYDENGFHAVHDREEAVIEAAAGSSAQPVSLNSDGQDPQMIEAQRRMVMITKRAEN